MASAGIRVSVIFDSLAYQAEALKEARKVMDNIQGQADRKPIKLNVTMLDKKNEKMLVNVQQLLDDTTTSSKTLKSALEQLAGQWRDLAARQAEMESSGKWLTKKGGLTKGAKDVSESMMEVNAAMAAVSERIVGTTSLESELSMAIAKRVKAQRSDAAERLAKESEYNTFLKQEMTTLEELDAKRKILNHKLTITPVGSDASNALIQELVNTEAEIRRVQAELARMKAEAVKAAMEMARELGGPKLIINELAQQVSYLTNAMKSVDIESDEFAEYGRALMDVSRDLDTANAAMQQYTYTTKQSAVAAEQFRIRYKEAMADTAQSVSALQARISVLREKLNKMDRRSGDYEATIRELAQNEIALKKVQAAQEELMSAQTAAVERELALRKQEVAAINAVDTTIVGLNAKLAYYQQLMNSNDVGSVQFQTAAREVMNLTAKMAELQAQIMRTTTADGSINRLSGELAEINRQWAAMGSAEKYVDSEMTQLSPKAQNLKEEYIRISAELQKQGKSLEQITSAEREALKLAEKRKEAEKREADLLSRTAKTISEAQEKVSILEGRMNSTAVGTPEFEKTAKDLQRAKKELAALREQATKYGTEGEEAINKVNKEFHKQHGYVGRLLIRMGLYSSIFAVARWTRNIREVTAEFELQRVALGSVIRDAEYADTLFNQIKGAAVKSPFEIKDLVSYTKQLSAYQVETDKLFDTMMRLADVSAGLGVDMSRLILAFGQVRTASVLRGQELRQFTENGIPLVQLLAEKFTELRGELVSTGEVFDLISDRAVPFSMIEEIFNDMTEAGGMFYQMQEKQAETLKGEWNNLKDSISIMFDEMGRSDEAQFVMEGMISIAKSLATNWRLLASSLDVLLWSLAAYEVTAKLSTIETNALTKAQALAEYATKKHQLSKSKLITAFFGESAALAVNNKMLKLHRNATVASATATNVLSKALWKVAAAILANPYAAAAAAIIGLVVAMVRLVSTSKSVEDSINDLEQATQKYNDVVKERSTVDEMIDDYERLSKQQNKTASETKKLADLTKNLASKFPSAIAGVDRTTGSLKLLGGEMRRLNEESRKAMALNFTREIQDNEKEYRKLANKNARYNEILEGGDITEKRRARLGGKISENIALMKKLETAINNAKDALNGLLNPPDEKPALDGWRKKIASFTKTLNGSELRIFTDDELRNFTHLDDALDSLAKKYKDYDQRVETLTNALRGKTGEEKTQIEAQKERAEAYRDIVKAILEYYNAMSLTTSKPSDNRLQNLQEEVSLVEKIYAKYKEYTKYMSKEDAKSKVMQQFASTIKGLRFGAGFDEASMKDILLKYQAAAKKLPKSEKVAMEIGFKADDTSWNAFTEQIKTRLATLKEEVSKSKEAKSFFDEILDLTGDKKLANSLSFSIFGANGDEVEIGITEQLREAFKEIKDVDLKLVDKAIVDRDYFYLSTLIDKIPEEYRNSAKELIKEGQKTDAEWLKNLIKTYQKTKTFAERIQDIDNRARQEMIEIDANTSLSPAEKDTYKKAVETKAAQDRAAVDLEEFKNLNEWEKIFADLDRMGSRTINDLIDLIDKFIEKEKEAGNQLSETDRKALQEAREKLVSTSEGRNSIKAFGSGVGDYIKGTKDVNTYRSALKKLTKGSNEYNQTLKKLKKAEDQQRTGLAKMGGAISNLGESFNTMGSIVSGIQDLFIQFGGDESSDFAAGLQGVAQAIAIIGTALMIVNAAITLLETHPLVLAATAIATALIAIVTAISNIKTARANREIDKQKDVVERLEYSYERLGKAIENAFGADYIQNLDAQKEALEARIVAYNKMIEAERSKGKKTDDDQIKDWETTIRDLKDEIADMEGQLAENFTGTDVTSAARDFASAWIDAYREFSSTSAAIKEKFHEMIQNMVVESLAAKVIQSILQPLFDEIEALAADGDLTANEIAKIAGETGTYIATVDTAMTSLMNELTAAGYNIRRESNGLSGISKDIATASEESVLGLAAGINTQNFYISHIYSSVDQILAVLIGGSQSIAAQAGVSSAGVTGQDYLSYLPNIAQNTADAVNRCERAAVACEEIANNISRVIKPKGTAAAYAIQVQGV